MIRFSVLQCQIPREVNPRILTHLGDKSLNQRTALGLGVDSGKMRCGIQLSNRIERFAAVYQIVDNQLGSDARMISR